MHKTAPDLGVKVEDLKKADTVVAGFIKDSRLAKYILGVDNAALVIKYLANSAQDLDAISNMDPIAAAGYIASTVIPNAAKLKPDVTSAPDPLDIPSGKAGGEKKNPYLEGVQFE